MPRLAALAGAALLTASLAACTGTPHACSAVGWSNQVRVHLSGDTAGVEGVTFCAGASCTPPPAPATPAPGTMSITTRSGNDWTISIDMTTPSTGHLAAFDAAGDRLIDQRVVLEWKRVGGTAECGGPERAEVELRMP
jgi:hypothetical protein